MEEIDLAIDNLKVKIHDFKQEINQLTELEKKLIEESNILRQQITELTDKLIKC